MFGIKTRTGTGSVARLATTIGLLSLGTLFGWFGREQFVVMPAPQQPLMDDHREAIPTLMRDANFHQGGNRDTGDELLRPLNDPSVKTPKEAHSDFAGPSDAEVMRALEDASTTGKVWSFLLEVKRDNVRIVKELVKDEVDEPRHYPLIGPAQLHHVRHKCTVTCTKTTHIAWPFAYTVVDQNVKEVIYIDHEQYHTVCNVDIGDGQE